MCRMCLAFCVGFVTAMPPMRGWMSWERFTCETDCQHFPETCIGEHLIKTTADAMVEEGLVAAGYTHIQIDDCWQAPHRDDSGAIVPDPKRFPSGMKALAELPYAIHASQHALARRAHGVLDRSGSSRTVIVRAEGGDVHTKNHLNWSHVAIR